MFLNASDETGHLHFCLSSLVVQMQVNDAQSSLSTGLLQNISTQYQRAENH